MTLNLELPEDLAARLTATYPDEKERNQWILCSLVDTIEWEQQDRAEMVETINVALNDIESGGRTYSQEEMQQHWEEMRAEMRRKMGQ